MITAAKSIALEQKATVNWIRYRDQVDDYLSNAAPGMWRKTFIPMVRGLVTDQVSRWSGVLGMSFDVQSLFGRDWYDKYIQGMPIPIIDTTKAAVGEIIDQAIADGWSVPQMQDAITQAFEIMEPYRTERIARTETIRASNAGSTDQFRAWGVQRHEWLSTKDDRTREPPESEFDHVAADGEVVNIGETFTLTGEPLMYPGDPAGDPGNTINCRCTTIPVMEGME